MVITKIDDETKITKGEVFFIMNLSPYGKRLDDEAWQKRLESKEIPSLS